LKATGRKNAPYAARVYLPSNREVGKYEEGKRKLTRAFPWGCGRTGRVYLKLKLSLVPKQESKQMTIIYPCPNVTFKNKLKNEYKSIA
jgi:hypothetical protein